MRICILEAGSLAAHSSLARQDTTSSAPDIGLHKSAFEDISVQSSTTLLDVASVLRVTKDPSNQAVDEPTFAQLKGIEFKNGTIEVRVLSRLLPNAPAFARGFIGVAFRVVCPYFVPAKLLV